MAALVLACSLLEDALLTPRTTQITCETTSGAAGTYAVSVTMNGAASVDYWGYTYAAYRTTSRTHAH